MLLQGVLQSVLQGVLQRVAVLQCVAVLLPCDVVLATLERGIIR